MGERFIYEINAQSDTGSMLVLGATNTGGNTDHYKKSNLY